MSCRNCGSSSVSATGQCALCTVQALRQQKAYASLGAWLPGSIIQSGPPAPPALAKFSGVVQDRTEPITGWRGYQIDSSLTLSGVRAKWPTRKFVAECSEGDDRLQQRAQLQALMADDEAYQFWLKRQMKDSPAARCVAHLENGDNCGCGVWGRALVENLPEGDWPVIAHCQAYGVVAVDAEGNFRASEVEIDELWVVKGKGQSSPQISQLSPGGHAYLTITGPSAAAPWYSAYVDWQKIADLLRDKYAVPVHVVESMAEVGGV